MIYRDKSRFPKPQMISERNCDIDFLDCFTASFCAATLLLKDYLNSYPFLTIQAGKKITGAYKSAVAISSTHIHIYTHHIGCFPPRLNALPVRCPRKKWAPCKLHMYSSYEHGKNIKKMCGPYTHVLMQQDDVKKDNDKKEADDEVRDDMQGHHCCACCGKWCRTRLALLKKSCVGKWSNWITHFQCHMALSLDRFHWKFPTGCFRQLWRKQCRKWGRLQVFTAGTRQIWWCSSHLLVSSSIVIGLLETFPEMSWKILEHSLLAI